MVQPARMKSPTADSDKPKNCLDLPSKVFEPENLDNDIHDSPRHNNDLFGLFTRKEGLNKVLIHNGLFHTLFVEIGSNGDIAALRQSLRETQLISTAVFLPCALVLLVLSPTLPKLFGDDFELNNMERAK